MKADAHLSFRQGDFIAVLLVALLALSAFVFLLPGGRADAQLRAQIYQGGSLIGEYPLFSERQIEIGGDYANLLSIEGGQIAVIRSDCPGGDCLRCGWIGESGRSIVCLPNRLEIRISGAAEPRLDRG